jgi:hypothetical protein
MSTYLDERWYDHSVCKSNDPPVAFEFTAHYEPRWQTFMNSADVADRVPARRMIQRRPFGRRLNVGFERD